MDRTTLLRRRENLLARQRRQQEARQFRELAPALCRSGVRRLSRLPASRSAALLAGQAAWPARDERFYWPEIPGSQTVEWEEDATRNAAFVDAVLACFPPTARLALVFHTAESSLVIDCADLVAHAPMILDVLGETLWVVSANGGRALVEVSFVDQQVAWLCGGA